MAPIRCVLSAHPTDVALMEERLKSEPNERVAGSASVCIEIGIDQGEGSDAKVLLGPTVHGFFDESYPRSWVRHYADEGRWIPIDEWMES